MLVNSFVNLHVLRGRRFLSMELNNKRALVVGLGKSGVASALFLKAHGAKVTVSDTKSGDELRNEIPVLLDHGITVETGGHGDRTFRGQDLIVVSPGVPVDAPPLVQARALGESVIGEIELAAQFLPGPIVAITGSNGKTTTTTLTGEIMTAAGFSALVGGGTRQAGDCHRPRGLKFSVGDDSNLPPESCGRIERHARSSRPAPHVRGLCRREGSHLRESAGKRLRGSER
jgi:Mur ligase middle domain